MSTPDARAHVLAKSLGNQGSSILGILRVCIGYKGYKSGKQVTSNAEISTGLGWLEQQRLNAVGRDLGSLKQAIVS